MKRILLVAVLTLSVIATAAPVFADRSPSAAAEEIGASNGALYAMFVPAAWNGRLAIYAHGFIDPVAPIALPDEAPADVAPWVVELRETLLSAGYAVAYSSYAENGWAVKDGAERTHELRDLFIARFGAPSHVYILGRSLGALITVMLAEKFPAAYQGALALCGPVGGGKLEIDYVGNSIVRVLGYHVRGTNDLLARTGGQVPFGNAGLRYTGLGLLLTPAVNAGVQRVRADAGGILYLDDFYRPRGALTTPLLTLHTTMDPDVPFAHEAALAKIVAAAKRSQWLAQQSVQRYGHCNVSPAEVARTFSRLVTWAEHQVKPASGDVTLDFATAFPVPTAQSTLSSTTSELTATIEAVVSATGLPLP